MSEGDVYCKAKSSDLLNRLEQILESDSLIDEVGFIHPSQFISLCEDAGSSHFLSGRTVSQSADGLVMSEASAANPLEMAFWCRDHKLGISIEVLFPLYNAAKHTFTAALDQYKAFHNSYLMKDGSGDRNESNCYESHLSIIETEVLKHSRALLLLSCDFGTAWNSRKLVVSRKQEFSLLLDELLLSALVLSYSPKSERAWSHRRWVIKVIAGKYTNLQRIVEKESEIVKKIAENSKMNYRAWNHRCWLVSYMSGRQVLHELNTSRDWAGSHVADNSGFHYRARLMLRLLEDSRHDQISGSGHYEELCQMWKEELNWDEMLIRRYVGREALWLHRRFLSLFWVKHIAPICDDACHSDHTGIIYDIDTFWNYELQLLLSCSTIPDSDFEDYQAQAIFSATYMIWLAKQISDFHGLEFQNKLPVEEAMALLGKLCPQKAVLLDSLVPGCGSLQHLVSRETGGL